MASNVDSHPSSMSCRKAINNKSEANCKLSGKFCYGAVHHTCMKAPIEWACDNSTTSLLAGENSDGYDWTALKWEQRDINPPSQFAISESSAQRWRNCRSSETVKGVQWGCTQIQWQVYLACGCCFLTAPITLWWLAWEVDQGERWERCSKGEWSYVLRWLFNSRFWCRATWCLGQCPAELSSTVCWNRAFRSSIMSSFVFREVLWH